MRLHRRAPAAPVSAKRTQDPFRLGSRIRRGSTRGQEGDEWIPLSAEDLVYPEEGPHFLFLAPMGDALRRYLERRPGIVVTSDVTLVARPSVLEAAGSVLPDRR